MKGFSDFLARWLLDFISFPIWSRIWGKIVGIKRPRWFSLALIRWFHQTYSIPMEEFKGEAEDYSCLKEFFVRSLDPASRPLSSDSALFLSPADGRISGVDHIQEDCYFQVKGKSYPLSLVLGKELDFSKGWMVITIYLAPHNYHRFHSPIASVVSNYLHCGRRLFPVNRFSVANVNRLFIRNERVVAEMESYQHIWYFVAVGATFVGSIQMAFPWERKPMGIWREAGTEMGQMDELGRFEQGSTLIIAVPESMVAEMKAAAGIDTRVGMPVFSINTQK